MTTRPLRKAVSFALVGVVVAGTGGSLALMANTAANAITCTTPTKVEPAQGVTQYWNNPNDTSPTDVHRKTAIADELVSLINSADNNSTIKIGSLVWAEPAVESAIEQAYTCRGVDVRVVLDFGAASDPTTNQYSALVAAIGTNTSNDSWVLRCGAQHSPAQQQACISQSATHINHNEFAIFSSVTP